MTPRPWQAAGLGVAAGVVGFVVAHDVLGPGWDLGAGALTAVVAGGLAAVAARARAQEQTAPSRRAVTEPLAAVQPPGPDGGYLAGQVRHGSVPLRTVRVRSRTAPLAAAGLELRLVIEHHDQSARTTLLEGWYERQPFGELLERTQAEALARAPAQGLRSLALCGYRSEGPVDAQGGSPLGWSFLFADGASGLHATVVVTPRDMTFHYGSHATWQRPPTGATPPTAASIAAALHALDASVAWMFRVWLPGGVVAWRAPGPTGRPAASEGSGVAAEIGTGAESSVVETGARLHPDDGAVDHAAAATAPESPGVPATAATPEPSAASDPGVLVDFDAVTGVVRNAEAVRQHGVRTLPESTAALTLDQLLDGLAHSESAAAPLDGWLEGLRAERLSTWQQAAHALLAAHGPALPLVIEERMAHEEDAEHRRRMVNVLGVLPSALAGAVLQRCIPLLRLPQNRLYAEGYLRNRRLLEAGMADDPLEALDEDALQLAMGRPTSTRIALRSTWDPEVDLLAHLPEHGLRETHRQELVGDSVLPVSVHYRGPAGVEAVLTSVPLPMPCHVLRVYGGDAAPLAQALHDAGLTYDADAIQADAASGAPHRAHRGALYLAALGQAAASGSGPLLQAHERGKADPHFRRAVLRALEFTPDRESREHLQRMVESADPLDAELARGILKRWHAAGIVTQAPRTALLPSIRGPHAPESGVA